MITDVNKFIILEHEFPSHKDWFIVNWCLGNTCSYACSYCPKGLHDGSIRWPELNTILQFIDKIQSHYSDKKLYFEFTGGEVTMYPEFVDVCKYCYSKGIHVGLITNASRTLRYFEENKKYFNHACVSYHSESAGDDKFIDIIKCIGDDVVTHVNIMMKPEEFDRCLNVANRVVEINNVSVALQPLIIDFGSELFDYSAEQLDIINNQWDYVCKKTIWTKKFPDYRGFMKVSRKDGSSLVLPAHGFISNELNNWKGWECNIGLEQMIVDMDGTIWGGWCKVGKPIGNINDDNIQFPTKPTICTKSMCHCNFDIMCEKKKPGSTKKIKLI
jgi:organic radical activating enzyme